ncbi:hypothetical protein ACFYMW_03060 [Streptomyces sp. NPDC006692]|uniref:hypothetical protein n=1 Tax=Streptomyces sp. NPDC006692 TaxID=3364758 RepID=UPI00369036C9
MQQWRDSHKVADDAASAFRDALALAGAPRRITAAINSTVGRRGAALVHVGYLPADLAERLAEAIRKGAA